ncbi:MAG: DEAD/DEAH box helicase, partial [Balneolaceae bacterium]
MKLLDLHKLSTKRLKALQVSGIDSVSDLLYLFPRRYLDKSNITPIQLLRESTEPVSVVGTITNLTVQGYARNRRLEVIVKDDTGSMKAVWFKGWKYFISQFNEGDLVSLFGKTKRYGKSMSMAHPDVDVLDKPEDIKKYDTLLPIYPSNQHFSKTFITNKIITGWIKQILSSTTPGEFLPPKVLATHNFPERSKAFHYIHQPTSLKQPKEALERFKYEEFFLFELSMAKMKRIQRSRAKGHPLKPGRFTQTFFNDVLPFELTEGQKSSLSEIRKDIQQPVQMNRLIQGDVGAGKTIVAIGAMLMAVDSGFQAAMMAPTEILAEQHYFTLKKYLEPLGVRFRLLVGGQKKSLRDDILADISGGNCNIVIGTHAVIQQTVQFNNLGLAVIDEQHRFGVKQRNEVLQKGENPHLLVMSATPIPRSLAMTVYSDLDISVIKDLPAGR